MVSSIEIRIAALNYAADILQEWQTRVVSDSTTDEEDAEILGELRKISRKLREAANQATEKLERQRT